MRTIDLSNPMLSCNDTGKGPWRVVLTHPTDGWNWYIFNTETLRYKKIGKVQLSGVSYFERAIEEARRRNVQTQMVADM